MAGPYMSPDELKHERVQPVSAGELRRVLMLVVLFAVSANVLAGVVLRRWSPNFGYAVANMKWERLLTLHEPVDWLVLGDSTANQGVDPQVLATHLGGRALNLATIADMTAINDAWMLQEYVRRFGPPRGVILVHAYDMWSREVVDQTLGEVPLPWGYWWRLDPPLQVGFARAVRLAALRYVPLYARQDSLLALIRGTAPRDVPPLTDGGFMEAWKAAPTQVDADAAEHLTFTRRGGRVLSDDNRRALAAIGALADEYGFEVFVASSPLYEPLYRDATFRGFYDKVGTRLKAWTNERPHRHYVFSKPVLFSRDVMQNADHVTTAGARHYTEVLAERIEAIRQRAGASGAAAIPE